MVCRISIWAVALAALAGSSAGAQIVDFSKYPNLKGQWTRFVVRGLGGQASFDQTKSWGFGQEAPLTPEYKAIEEASLADQADGGHGNNYDHARCVAAGMPRMMIAFRPLEFVIMPETTYILVGDQDQPRRVFTDGRDWPKWIEPSFAGYSIGKWVDEAGSGRFDLLVVETRGFKGPRDYDTTGLPLHYDNQSIFKERIHLDKADPDILHDEITVIDHAYTRPWTVMRDYARLSDPQWVENNCAAENHYVVIKNETYFISADGHLMPTKKDQPAPDLRNFTQSAK